MELEKSTNIEVDSNELVTEKEQNNFLESTIGKVVNSALDVGLRMILPDFLEDGIVERHLAKEMEDEAIKYMRLFQKLFHDHYYIMLQNHHLKMQEKGNERMMSLARYVKVKVICSNEVRYLKKQDALAVDLLQASAQGITLDAQYQPLTQEKYLKDEKEMERLFPPEIIEETRHVCTTCKATIPLNEKYLPTYPVPHQGKAVDYLRSLCHVGLKKRFQNQEIPVTYQKRLLYELKIIHEMGFDDYFLIVWDYVRWAKVQKIQVGPGRGSANLYGCAGTAVGRGTDGAGPGL